MSNSLKNKTLDGMFWSGIERFATQGVQFLLQIVLARLLMPEDYGVIAMLAIFMAVGQTFIDSGFSRALIQKQNCTENDFTTTLIFNVLIGFVAFAMLYVFSGTIAEFYDIPLLENVAKLVACIFVFNSLCIVQQAKLTIVLDFKSQALVSLSSVIVSGAIAIWMAMKGCGAWSIAVQMVVNSALRCVFFWLICKWTPKGRFNQNSFKSLFNFGSKLLASALINTIYTNIYTLFIGKVYSSQSLGFYSRAKQFSTLPSSTLTGVMQRVVFPVLSKLKNNDDELREKYLSFLRLSAFIIFPLMVGLACVARPLILSFLTDKWLGSVYLLQIICIGGMLYPIHAINLSLLEVKNRTDLFLRVEMIKRAIGMIILIVSLQFDLHVVCYGLVLSSMISLLVNTFYSGKLLDLTIMKQLKELMLTFMGCLFMAAMIALLNLFFVTENSWILLCLDILVGGGSFVLFSLVFKSPELKYLIKIIKEKK